MTNPVSVLLRSKGLLFALLILAVVGVVTVGLLTMSDDKPEAINTVDPSPSATPSTTPTTPSPTPTKETPTVEVPDSTLKCIGPDELFNVEGADVDTLRPDCGDAVTPIGQAAPLGLGCGGTYPTIMFKTSTETSKATVCGTNSSGEDLRMVTKVDNGPALDLKAEYEPGLDAFVARKDGTTYLIEAYNGSLTVKKAGAADRQESRDWISLDNESDYD